MHIATFGIARLLTKHLTSKHPLFSFLDLGGRDGSCFWWAAGVADRSTNGPEGQAERSRPFLEPGGVKRLLSMNKTGGRLQPPGINGCYINSTDGLSTHHFGKGASCAWINPRLLELDYICILLGWCALWFRCRTNPSTIWGLWYNTCIYHNPNKGL